MIQTQLDRIIRQQENRVREFADRYRISERDLRPRVLLQLYRRAEYAEADFEHFAGDVLEREAARLEEALREFHIKYPADASGVGDVAQMGCRELSEEEAQHIFGRLHYLRRFPLGMSTIAGVHPISDRPLIAIAYGPSRWRELRRTLRKAMGYPDAEVLDVARVYAFDEVPRYATSWILARLLSALRRTSQAQRIVSTVVDTSLGFRGSSYIASGWSHVAVAEARPYTYLDGEYLPVGELKIRYGTGDPSSLREMLGSRFAESDWSTQRPSLIFGRTTKRSTCTLGEPAKIRRYRVSDHHVSRELR